MKKCSKCELEKDLLEFHKDKNSKDGYYSSCKLCKKKYQKSNSHILKINCKKYYYKNRDTLLIKNREKYYTNQIDVLNYHKNWRYKNKIRINERAKVIDKNRRLNDINYKIKKNLRSRLYKTLKRNSKYGSAISDLGCSLEKFKLWLEMHWQDGMNWDNYGEWHIDHIQPLSSFNLSNKIEFLQANHFSNLQPLWAKDNLSKSDKTCLK